MRPEPEAIQSPRDLGNVLSPSQVRCFMDCQVRWWHKYGLKVPDPATGKMALGKAVHYALTHNLTQKLDTREDLPVIGVIALFREAWNAEAGRTEFREDEDSSQLKASGEALVSKYMDELAPGIDPAAVEIRVEGLIAGVKVQGWIDVLDSSGRIIDIKTVARRPVRIEPDCKFQIATYVQLTRGASGEARVDNLVKTKTPAIVSQNCTINDQDLLATRRIYALAQQAMKSGLYVPNRLSMTCSRSNCSYWRHCEREWGGEVPQT